MTEDECQELYDKLRNLLPKPGSWVEEAPKQGAPRPKPGLEDRAVLNRAWAGVTEEGATIFRIYWSEKGKKGFFDVPLAFAYGGVGLAELITSETYEPKSGPVWVRGEIAVFIVGRALAYLEREHNCVCKGAPRPLT